MDRPDFVIIKRKEVNRRMRIKMVKETRNRFLEAIKGHRLSVETGGTSKVNRGQVSHSHSAASSRNKRG